MDISKYLPVSIEAALLAGKTIMQIFNEQEINIKEKFDKSPVTQADTESSEIICQHLSVTTFPVISEEVNAPDYSIRKNWNQYWLVDPLDGTKEFISRNGEFTVNIALVENNIPVLGIIYIPVTDCIYFGIKGAGAWKTENATQEKDALMVIKTGEQLAFTNKNIFPRIISSRSHSNTNTTEFIKKTNERYGKTELITSGSAVKLCLLAEGKADIYPRYGTTMEWDTAAGQVIAEEFGIELLSNEGLPLKYNKPDLRNPSFIAYNPKRYQLNDIF